jgi:hypothetical protein
MRQLGWVDGQNMAVERRFGESADQLRAGAADLVRLNVDVLFVSSGPGEDASTRNEDNPHCGRARRH